MVSCVRDDKLYRSKLGGGKVVNDKDDEINVIGDNNGNDIGVGNRKVRMIYNDVAIDFNLRCNSILKGSFLIKNYLEISKGMMEP